jgi:hypothetical protein
MLRMRSMVLGLAIALLLGVQSAWADVDAGLRAAHEGDYEAAVAEWRPVAQDGNARAEFLLGLAYRTGKGVAQDPANAVRWFQKAAAQGNVDAQSALGTMLLIGEGVPADYSRAFVNLDAAAKAGDRRAMYALGVYYESGLDKPADVDIALGWYEKSANLGLADAQDPPSPAPGFCHPRRSRLPNPQSAASTQVAELHKILGSVPT